MASFEDILKDINTGMGAVAGVLPTISANGIGSVQSIQSIVATAGAVAASSTTDQGTQAEIVASAQTALAFIPVIFSFFHKKASAPVA